LVTFGNSSEFKTPVWGGTLISENPGTLFND